MVNKELKFINIISKLFTKEYHENQGPCQTKFNNALESFTF